MSAKILFLDIETAPILMASWSMRSPEASAVWVERDTHLLMFSYKWSHERTVKTCCLPDFDRYRRSRYDDKDLCGVLHRLLDAADIVVAHNGDRFDIPKINSRLIVNGFKCPSPYKTIDTLKIARRAFKFDSNKLDNIGRYLSEGRKIPNTGAALWRGCVEGDPKSWGQMRRYGKQATAVLEKAYHRLKSWAPNHPDLNAYSGADACPTCQSKNVQKRGVMVKLKAKRQRLHCQDCGAWFSGEKDDGSVPEGPANAVKNRAVRLDRRYRRRRRG